MNRGVAQFVKVWGLAIRPKTLFAAVTPVLLGTVLAYSHRHGAMPAAAAAFLGAVFIQIGTNFANDYWDAKKGADNENRLGPTRVTSSGLLSPRAVFLGMVIAFLIAAFAGLFLISQAGWPILVVGIISIISGVLYTAGPFPLAYIGLGDLFAFVFFGPVAVACTYFVQAHELSLDAVILGFVPGSYSVVLIALNNFRDRESDVAVNKKTLAVRFGDTFARAEIAVFCFMPAVIPFVLVVREFSIPVALACSSVAFIGGLAICRSVYKIRDRRAVNALFPRTGLVSVLVTILLSLFLLR